MIRSYLAKKLPNRAYLSINSLLDLLSKAVTRHAKIAIWIIGFVAVLFVLLDLRFGPWDRDGGYYLLVSRFILNGLRPHLDFVTRYPPAVPFFSAGLLGAIRDPLTALYLIPCCWIFTNALLTYKLSQLLSGDRLWSVIASLSFLVFSIENEGGHLTLEHGIIAFSLLSMIFSVYSKARPSLALLSGVSAGLAVLSKQIGLLAVLPAIPILLDWTNAGRKRIALWCLGGLLVLVAFLSWLAWDWRAIFREEIIGLINYARPSNTLELHAYNQEFLRSPFTAVYLLFFGIIGPGLLLLLKPARPFLIMAGWISLVIFASFRFQNNFPHYTLNCWPGLLIVAIEFHRFMKAAIKTVGILLLVGTLSTYGWTFLGKTGRWEPPLVSLVFEPAARFVKSSGAQTIAEFGSESVVTFLAETMPASLAHNWDTVPSELQTRPQMIVLTSSPGIPNEFHDELKRLGYQVHFSVRQDTTAPRGFAKYGSWILTEVFQRTN